jgi:flagellar basal body-associated protein FliL
MRNRLVLIPILAVAVLAVLSLLVSPAGAQAPKPITKQGLIDALRIGGLTLQELMQFVRDRGVDFQVTPEVEAELRSAAAQRELIEAVRGSFRGAVAPGAPAVPAAPLTKNEIVTLLQVGTPATRIEQLVGERSVRFAMTPEIARELQAAGATRPLIDSIARRAPAAAPARGPAATPAAVPAGPKLTPNITSLRAMKKLYIEKMPSELDQFIRAEITKELKDRIMMVLSKEEADAIMTGSGENRTGTGAQVTGRVLGLHDNSTGAITISDRTGSVVLWSSEAGDRSLFWGSVRRGGPRKVADRLVNNLKKALQ